MKRILYLLIPTLMAFASCTKESINNSPTPGNGSGTGTDPVTSTQGYIVVKCDNCKIDYGMPDQYHGANISGTSANLPYNYQSNYNLQANLYALDHNQTITYIVFDAKGKQIFNNSTDQSTENFWQVNVLLP